jgi:hypothetical protein
MGRCTVTRWAFVAGLLCYCGCTGPQTFSPFGWMRGNDATNAQSASANQKNNPLKPADQVASDDDASSSKSEGDVAADLKSPDKPGKNGFKTGAVDPELRKLMDTELASEAPEERKRLYEQWSKFDPSFIRELVDNHRMAREMAESRQQPVKLASADGSPNQTAQAPEMDAPSPVRPSANAAAPAEPTVRNQSPPPSQNPANPWSESSDMPPVSTTPAAPAAPSTPPSTPPANPARSAAPAAQNAPDAFDSLGGPGQPARPISTVPTTPPTGAAQPVPAASQPKPGAGSPPPSNSDAFSSMMPLDDPGTPAPAATPRSAAAAPAAPAAPSTPAPNAASTSTDGLLIQPGVAAPASVISNLQPQPKGLRAGGDAFDSPPVAPSLNAPAAVPPTAPAANSAAVADTTQPVQLQPPTDMPSNTTPAPTPAADAKSPVTPASATAAAPPPSGLAGLGNRLMGAISPNLNAAARTALQSGNFHDELQKIVAFAASEAGQTSVGTTDTEKLKYVEKQVHLRMLYLLSGQSAKSLEPISGLDPADQEFWQQVFWGLSNYFDKTAMADPSDRATQTIAQLRTAVQRLKEKSKLELRNVAFCQKISSFGNYERVKRDEFAPGQSVLLYAEVENFKSEPTTEGPYRTILKSTIEVFDSHGGLVVRMPFQATDDLCASQRRDYYITYEFAVPQRIGIGAHTLKLTVEDQISHKVATYTVNFTVK